MNEWAELLSAVGKGRRGRLCRDVTGKALLFEQDLETN